MISEWRASCRRRLLPERGLQCPGGAPLRKANRFLLSWRWVRGIGLHAWLHRHRLEFLAPPGCACGCIQETVQQTIQKAPSARYSAPLFCEHTPRRHRMLPETRRETHRSVFRSGRLTFHRHRLPRRESSHGPWAPVRLVYLCTTRALIGVRALQISNGRDRGESRRRFAAVLMATPVRQMTIPGSTSTLPHLRTTRLQESYVVDCGSL